MPGDAYDLLCAEDDAAGSALLCTTDDDDGCCSAVEDDSAAASIAELIGGEAQYSPRPDYPDRLRSRSIDPAARAESVAWILKVTDAGSPVHIYYIYTHSQAFHIVWIRLDAAPPCLLAG